MRILLVGAGGVGSAVAAIAARRDFVEHRVVAADEDVVHALLAEHRCDALLNATDPRFVMPLFRAALAARVHYLDMAMSLSRRHPEEPHRRTGVKLGDE